MLPFAVVPFHALLHRHGTGQRGRRRGEHHHEPVTQVLDLGATRFGDGLAQDREVPPADLVCGLGRQALRQLRRAHHVGEQDRRALGTQESSSRLEVTRVDADRNGLLRRPMASSGGYGRAPISSTAFSITNERRAVTTPRVFIWPDARCADPDRRFGRTGDRSRASGTRGYRSRQSRRDTGAVGASVGPSATPDIAPVSSRQPRKR